jgi:hypothetical protein
MPTIASQLEGRAAAFKLDAASCHSQADACSDNERKYRELINKATVYRMAADELLILADQWRGTDGKA